MSVFYHYNSSFDAEETILRHAVPDLSPNEMYLTNFLGVLIDPKFFPDILRGKENQVEAVPIPANWHADIAEWAGALRAVELADRTFTVVELGCGWGCWLNNTGVAARRAGLAPHLIGVEGDVGHIEFAREAYLTNGFSPQEVTLFHGIASASEGIALFPCQAHAGMHWGLEPILNATVAQRLKAKLTGRYEEMPMISMQKITEAIERVDLLHIDIQGGEAALIEGSLSLLNNKVAYIVVGTHSREIEGQIMSSLRSEGWLLEIERPAIFTLPSGVPQLTVDGVQGWRNSRFKFK